MKAQLGASGKNAVFMIVDDNCHNLKSLRQSLEFFGYTVIEATNGVDCLEKLTDIYSNGQKVDCLLIDVIMPGMSGFELCQAIRKQKNISDIPISQISVLSSSFHQAEALQSGADFCLCKPVEKQTLIAHVKMMVDLSKYREIKKIMLDEINSEEKLSKISTLC